MGELELGDGRAGIYNIHDGEEDWDALFGGVIKEDGSSHGGQGHGDGVEECQGHGDGIGDGNDGPEEGVRPKGAVRLQKPSKAAIAEHELTHIPYRDWCVHCSRASCRNGPHIRKSDDPKAEERGNAVGLFFYFDYTYLTDCSRWIKKEGLEEALKNYKTISRPILVELDGRTDALVAHRVDAKGTADGWPAKRMLEDMHDVGYGNTFVVTRCAQAFPIDDLHNTIGRMCGGVAIPTHSAVRDSEGTGRIENAIERFQNKFRWIIDKLQ